jgi:hypothetical protein
MLTVRDTTLIGMFAALLLGVQFVLSFVPGVELVSATLFIFAVVFGTKRGVITAVTFSVLRCIIYSAIPTVIVLYMIYFPLYAYVASLCGKISGKRQILFSVIVAMLLTVCFTLLDDVISPLMWGLNSAGWQAYFIKSLPVMCIQPACVGVTVAAFYPTVKPMLIKLKLAYFFESREDREE